MKAIVEKRRELDETLFAPEVDAQRHEAVFVGLWDDLSLSMTGVGDPERLQALRGNADA